MEVFHFHSDKRAKNMDQSLVCASRGNTSRYWYKQLFQVGLQQHKLPSDLAMWTVACTHMCTCLNFFKIYFYVYEYFACIYFCGPHTCSAHGGQKRASDGLELELQRLCAAM